MKAGMKFLSAILIVLLTMPAYAGHNHGGGSPESMGHSSAQSQNNEQTIRAADQLLKECSQHLDNIQRQINRLQGQLVDGKAATSSINGELENLAHHLNEAKSLARSLRVF